MDEPAFLFEVVVLLAAAVVAVFLFKRLRVSPILGYLAAGLAIGPSGLALAEAGADDTIPETLEASLLLGGAVLARYDIGDSEVQAALNALRADPQRLAGAEEGKAEEVEKKAV